MRRDGDSWDLASHVGATATLVAAGRARATNSAEPLIEDPFAEPLVRSVGIEFLTKWATGELCASEVDEPEAAWGLARMTTDLVARTRYFDRFLADATATGIRQAVILRPGSTRAATGCRGRPARWCSRSTNRTCCGSRPQRWHGWVPSPRRSCGWCRPTCATTGRPRCCAADSTRRYRRPGSPKGFSVTCPRRLRIACWTTSPASARREVGWPPRRSWGHRNWTAGGSKR